MHYQIPTHNLDKGSPFLVNDKKYLQENTFYRHNAEIVLNEIVEEFEKAEPVRVWPHHFDTGSFIPIAYNGKGSVSKSVGLGWAIPDSMENEPYYYLNFWSENPADDVKDLPTPDAGDWIKSGWNGGVLKLSELLDKSSATEQYNLVKSFFNSGIKIFTDHFK
ncbi:hypothetical protein ES705_49981 [subsurface metagenome]